jgi:hypothetical protein
MRLEQAIQHLGHKIRRLVENLFHASAPATGLE